MHYSKEQLEVLERFAVRTHETFVRYFKTWYRPLPAKDLFNCYSSSMRKHELDIAALRTYCEKNKLLRFIRTVRGTDLVMPGEKDAKYTNEELQDAALNFEAEREEQKISRKLLRDRMKQQRSI